MNNDKYKIIKISSHPERIDEASLWFHQKWNVPRSAYVESMEECCKNKYSVPEWYIVVFDGTIVGGLGVIENDFHERKDLSPNVCAVYVEPEHRNKGIAGMMLNYVCNDMSEKGVRTLYLLTDHDSFYERYGWEFLCLVRGDGEDEPSRMYVHKKL